MINGVSVVFNWPFLEEDTQSTGQFADFLEIASDAGSAGSAGSMRFPGL